MCVSNQPLDSWGDHVVIGTFCYHLLPFRIKWTWSLAYVSYMFIACILFSWALIYQKYNLQCYMSASGWFATYMHISRHISDLPCRWWQRMGILAATLYITIIFASLKWHGRPVNQTSVESMCRTIFLKMNVLKTISYQFLKNKCANQKWFRNGENGLHTH